MPLNIQTIDCTQSDASAAIAALRERLSPRGDVVSEAGRQRTMELFGRPLSPQQVVERICDDVRSGGLAALLDYTQKLDRKELTAQTLRVSDEELATAHAEADADYLGVIRRIRDNITEFQRECLPGDACVVRVEGGARIELRQRHLPLRRVGICIPGGAAAYPSTLLMTAVPAQAAGVRELAVVAPPTPFGAYNTDLLAVCHELEVDEVYRLGGAQGVAALAYGAEGIAPVQKIVGPGNLFVALAKQHVFGRVDIDSIAGPSEVIVLADDTARADYVASDLIAQAEHSPGASILVTWSERLWNEVPAELAKQLAAVERGDLASASLEQFGALVLAEDVGMAVEIVNQFAPEHLHILAADGEALIDRLPNAGAVFLGDYSPVAIGDYVAGPSHVLPTSGTAQFARGLSANDFLRPHSVIHYRAGDLVGAADDVQMMAEKELLTAHWQSVKIRLEAARKESGG